MIDKPNREALDLWRTVIAGHQRMLHPGAKTSLQQTQPLPLHSRICLGCLRLGRSESAPTLAPGTSQLFLRPVQRSTHAGPFSSKLADCPECMCPSHCCGRKLRALLLQELLLSQVTDLLSF